MTPHNTEKKLLSVQRFFAFILSTVLMVITLARGVIKSIYGANKFALFRDFPNLWRYGFVAFNATTSGINSSVLSGSGAHKLTNSLINHPKENITNLAKTLYSYPVLSTLTGLRIAGDAIMEAFLSYSILTKLFKVDESTALWFSICLNVAGALGDVGFNAKADLRLLKLITLQRKKFSLNEVQAKVALASLENLFLQIEPEEVTETPNTCLIKHMQDPDNQNKLRKYLQQNTEIHASICYLLANERASDEISMQEIEEQYHEIYTELFTLATNYSWKVTILANLVRLTTQLPIIDLSFRKNIIAASELGEHISDNTTFVLGLAYSWGSLMFALKLINSQALAVDYLKEAFNHTPSQILKATLHEMQSKHYIILYSLIGLIPYLVLSAALIEDSTHNKAMLYLPLTGVFLIGYLPSFFAIVTKRMLDKFPGFDVTKCCQQEYYDIDDTILLEDDYLSRLEDNSPPAECKGVNATVSPLYSTLKTSLASPHKPPSTPCSTILHEEFYRGMSI